MDLLDQDQSRALTERVLAMSRADSTSVWVRESSKLNLRFANNDITTNGTIDSIAVSATASFGKRSASIAVNQLDDETLRKAIRKVETMAKLAPENPEHMPPLGPAEFDEPLTYAASTAAAGAAELTRWIRPAVEASREAGVLSAGFLQRDVHHSTFATSKGLFAHQRATGCGFSMTARTPEGGGSGWASTQVTDSAGLDLVPVAARAIDKARSSRNPKPLAPGRTTVVLEPPGVRNLVSLLAWNLDRRSLDEERSFLNRLSKNTDTPVGETLFGKKATLISDPLFAPAPCSTHAYGLPRTRTPWIENGILKNLHVGRFWAQKQDINPLPRPGNLILPGDGHSVEDLIGQVDEGVLITRLWYIRMVQPQTLLYTGLTRDGTFRIEKGRITGPVNNFRFNETPVNLLKQIAASGVPERVLGSEGSMPMHVPPLLVENFNLSSPSDAS